MYLDRPVPVEQDTEIDGSITLGPDKENNRLDYRIPV